MSWLLLIFTLPTENSAARMRAWRALKACGAAVLRDGVSLLPDLPALRVALADIAREVEAAGGSAHVFSARGIVHEDAAYTALFDRTADYAELAEAIRGCPLDESGARQARKLDKSLAALAGIDFFPGEAQAQTRARLEALHTAIAQRLSPHEPSQADAPPARFSLADHQGRVWATRRRPWVDRLASAWLIRRFIDPAARFLWLASPADCPANALGFDFDGATFTHSEAGGATLVTFETLLASFGLCDTALNRLARVVHSLDVGGLPEPQAPGLESLLAGMRASIDDDDALLAAACRAFDYLYTTYQTEHPQSDPAP